MAEIKEAINTLDCFHWRNGIQSGKTETPTYGYNADFAENRFPLSNSTGGGE